MAMNNSHWTLPGLLIRVREFVRGRTSFTLVVRVEISGPDLQIRQIVRSVSAGQRHYQACRGGDFVLYAILPL